MGKANYLVQHAPVKGKYQILVLLKLAKNEDGNRVLDVVEKGQ
jgi:hypothetical protein